MQAVIFDFYDTLAYIQSPIVEAGRQELARLAGVPPERFQPLWRDNRQARMLGTAGSMQDQLQAMLAKLGIHPSPDELTALADFEFRTWQRGVRLYDDTRPTLTELRRRDFRLAVLSNCSCQAGAAVRHHGLPKLVDTLALSCEVGLAKPDPAIYQYVCAELGLAPADCVYVADGAGGELEAAHTLGLLTVRIHRPNQRSPEDPTVQADHRIGSLPELLALLDGR